MIWPHDCRPLAGLGLIACATLLGCKGSSTDAQHQDTGPVGDLENITADPSECGYSVGFAWPFNPEDPSDWEEHLYYADPISGNERPFLASSSSGAHVGADLIASAGDEVFSGVTGKVVRYRTSGHGGEGGGYSFVAVVASFIVPAMTWENGHDDEVSAEAYLTIYGHIRSTSELSGGTPSGLSEGDCVVPTTTIGWVQEDGYNGDGAEHLHYGVRLQSVEDAQALPSDYWYEGYETDGSRTYYADPIDPLTATITVEDWAEDSFNDLHDDDILDDGPEGYRDRITWNRAEVATIMARVLDLESTAAFDNCACPFDDVDAASDWFAPYVCSLTWLEYGDGVTPFRNESGNLISFNPGQVLTRAQFLKVLIESYDHTKVYSGADFDDLDEAGDLDVYIHTGVDLGLVTTGSDNPEFRPNDVVTKGEVAVFVDRAVTLLGRPTPSANDFSDDPNSQCGDGW